MEEVGGGSGKDDATTTRRIKEESGGAFSTFFANVSSLPDDSVSSRALPWIRTGCRDTRATRGSSRIFLFPEEKDVLIEWNKWQSASDKKRDICEL